MKLETLLTKNFIFSIDALGHDVRSAIEETIGRYGGYVAVNVAFGLARVARDTRDKDAVVESARTIGRYSGDAAESVSWGLEGVATGTRDKDAVLNVARIMSLDEIINTIKKFDGAAAESVAWGSACVAGHTGDKDAVVESARTIGRYSGDAAESVARGLAGVATETRDKDAVLNVARIMSLDEIIKTVKKFDGAAAESVSWRLACVARHTGDKDAVVESARTIGRYSGDAAESVTRGLEGVATETRDKDAVLNVARIMSLDEIINTIKKFDGAAAESVTRGLEGVARDTRDKDAVVESARTIGRYSGDAAESVSWGLERVATGTRDKDAVLNVARIMSLDEIIKTVKKFDGAAAEIVSWRLACVAGHTGDKDAVVESARTIGRYSGDAAESVALGLESVARDTGDKDAVVESARTIGRYSGDAAESVARGLERVAGDTGDKDAVRLACYVVKIAGSGVFDILDYRDLKAIKQDGLDKLIEGKDSLDTVAAYVKSDGELPLPTKENLKKYGDLASKYISDAYGIRKKLDAQRTFMLFSINKAQRKGLVELVNRSTESNRREYSISAEGGRQIDVDQSRLPYLLLIAVMGSRDKQKEKEAFDLASGIAGEKAVSKARNSFNSSYRSRISEIASYVNKGEVDKAMSVLRDTNDESINDVLACMDYRKSGFSGGKTMLSAVESKNPLDYDSRVQMACVYLPRDYNEGIYEYCKDDRFTLVRYDIGGKPLGSAICYMENGTFLVDSVEGHRTFSKPEIFDAVYKDLIERARERGANKILFSDDCGNATPKDFVKYLGDKGLKRGKVKMDLNTAGYLEADEDGVNGYLIETTL